MLTREEIKAVYDQGPEAVIALVEQLYLLIVQQQEQIAQLQARVKELEDRLATNSRNSSKPPSSDGFAKKTRSLRHKSAKKPGAQTGHKATFLALVDTPDQRLVHAPEQCRVCHGSLLEVSPTLTAERRQVVDLPPLQM